MPRAPTSQVPRPASRRPMQSSARQTGFRGQAIQCLAWWWCVLCHNPARLGHPALFFPRPSRTVLATRSSQHNTTASANPKLTAGCLSTPSCNPSFSTRSWILLNPLPHLYQILSPRDVLLWGVGFVKKIRTRRASPDLNVSPSPSLPPRAAEPHGAPSTARPTCSRKTRQTTRTAQAPSPTRLKAASTPSTAQFLWTEMLNSNVV